MKNRLIIVDISSFIFRAYYAIRLLHAPDKTPVNAVQGVWSMLLKLITEYKPTHMFLARDSKGPSFRNDIYAEYKAHRPPPPPDLVPQFALIEELIAAMGLKSLSLPEYEADDIIGSVCVQWRNEFDEVIIASSDKDLMQFVGGHVRMLDTMKGQFYGPQEVFDKMGVYPEQICDYLSIVGDTADNIPGLKGIGPKGASKLLEEYKTLDNIIANKDKLTGKKIIEGFTQHLDELILSKKLVEIKTDIPLNIVPMDTLYIFGPNEKLVSFFEKLAFKSAILKLKEFKTLEVNSLKEAGSVSCHIIQTQEQIDQLKSTLSKTEKLSCYSNYSVDNEMNNRIVGLCLSVDGKESFYLPFEHTDSSGFKNLNPGLLKEFLELIWEDSSKEIFFENSKTDYSYYLSLGKEIKCKIFDIGQAHYLIDSSGNHDLSVLSVKNLNQTLKNLDKGETLSQMPEDFVKEYAGERANCLYQLGVNFKEEIHKLDVESVYLKLDCPLIPILSKMEREGISVNINYLKKFEGELEEELSKIKEEILLQIKKEKGIDDLDINLKSPKQVSDLLFQTLGLPIIKKTKTGASTDSEVLEELDARNLSTVPGIILKYREIDKILSTYVKALPLLVNPLTQRIHTTFSQNVAATGRLSSNNPNLQNIPIRSEIGRKVRKAFIAKPGQLLLSADYSQIELRIMAHMSQDPTMIKAFNEDQDIHMQTACEIMGVGPHEISPNDRALAKAVNFGLMYGQSSFGLAATLRISRVEARDYITKYFERFSSIKAFLDRLKEGCEAKGYVQTMHGRKRFLPDINSQNRTIKSLAERMAINAPIQGTAADIVKVAMIEISKKISELQLKSRMLLQVHDELIFEVPEDELNLMRNLVKEKMENAVVLKVPLKVEMGVGVNWYDLK